MKKYARVFAYLSQYKGEAVLYIVFTLLSILFSLVSFGMLLPFLEIIFNGNKLGAGGGMLGDSNNPLVNSIRSFLSESIQNRGSVPTLGIICVMIIVAIFFKNLFLYLAYYILNPLKNRIVNRLRNELYEKVLHLPIGFFTEKRKGDIISRITNDVGEVEASVVGTLEGWVRDPLTILVTLATLLVISYQLTLFVLLCIPIVGFVVGRISRSLKRGSNEVALLGSESLSVLDETLTGLRVIKAFNAEPLLRNRFFGINAQLVNEKNKIGFRRDLASPASELMGVMIFTAILFFGGQLVLNGELLTGSLFIVYLGLFYQLINPTKTLSNSFSNMAKGTAAIERIEEILKTKSAVDDNPDGKKLDQFSDGIELRNVAFTYDGVPVLHNINVKIPKGKTVALVGSSGAGKSTLADLVPRFHDVSSGELLIDGVNIKEYSLRSVREHISIVTQEPILFNDTIEANIRLGQQEASQQQIEEAAKVANAYHFITKKEAGFKTNIGDRGTKLSGGERQRLTIARAIAKNPPILILDEATSSLDTESERLVQDAINKMMQNRTSIVIAHRLSTIRHADEILVLQKGEIVERGTHEELLQRQGYYYKLVQMQEVK